MTPTTKKLVDFISPEQKRLLHKDVIKTVIFELICFLIPATATLIFARLEILSSALVSGFIAIGMLIFIVYRVIDYRLQLIQDIVVEILYGDEEQ